MQNFSSSLSWITFKNDDLLEAREILRSLAGEATVDSLGLGLPFESISNAFFPATSTLHTRLRYQVFVGAIFYKMYFESEARQLKNPEKRLNQLENQLLKILIQNDVKGGVIGRVAQAELKYWPSQTYWGGINTMKIFSDSNIGREELFNDIRARAKLRIINDDGNEEDPQELVIHWDKDFEKIVMNLFDEDKFKDNINFSLSRKEGEFFKKRLELIENGKNSLLYMWIRKPVSQIKETKNFMSIHLTGNQVLDELLNEAKNYSRLAMGISYAYQFAICHHRANVFLKDNKLKKEEWNQYAQNNLNHLKKWLRNNSDLKSWDIGSLKKALFAFDKKDKIDIDLVKLVDQFKAIWKTGIDVKSLGLEFMPFCMKQEAKRRPSRNHFKDKTVKVASNAKGLVYQDALFDYRFNQGLRNSCDISMALKRSV